MNPGWKSLPYHEHAHLTTIDKLKEIHRSFYSKTRAFLANKEIYRPFLLISRAQGESGKNEQPTQTSQRGPPEARGPTPNSAASVASA